MGVRIYDSIKPLTQSGRYMPTLTLTSNLTSASATTFSNWYRIGRMVHVSGLFVVKATAAGGVLMDVSLPIASTFTIDDFSLNGFLAVAPALSAIGGIYDNTANSPITAQFAWTAADNLAHGMRYAYDYVIEP